MLLKSNPLMVFTCCILPVAGRALEWLSIEAHHGSGQMLLVIETKRVWIRCFARDRREFGMIPAETPYQREIRVAAAAKDNRYNLAESFVHPT